MKLKKNKGIVEVDRNSVIKFLFDTMNEVINEGLPYDSDAKKQFSKEEFNGILNDYRMFGNLFGSLFIGKIVNKIDNMVTNKQEKEEK